ncbi:hypothetical protein GCM10027079_03730 [Sediminivirga luteola]|uniref:Uncharacterized protein n=1 Tax=Sediminivirga luteola TaxID=1774748 RepID=A0A8J2XJX6_9MICO|nr:hypothetical protein GCM10011333_10930 [Sediminivirga luteola]
MECGETTVERGKPAAVTPGQLSEVGIGDLAVPHDPVEADAGISNVIDPQLVSWVLRFG